jgi:hypothetical protein
MDRRDIIAPMAAAGGAPALGVARATDSPATSAGSSPSAPLNQSRAAFQELLAALREIDARWLGPERHIGQPLDIADGHRVVLHLVSAGLELIGEADPERPVFRRVVSPIRKFEGDNPDALYYSAYVRPDRSYRISGNLAGATYTSVSFELGNADGHFPTGVARAINDTELKAAPDGGYEIRLGPEPRPGNWFRLEPAAGSITTRHYYEAEISAAIGPARTIPITIECLDKVGPKPAPTEESVAAATRRVTNWMRAFTLDHPQLFQPGAMPSWVSMVPNRFNPAALPGANIGFANRDAYYTMAPYALKPDEALVIEKRFPKGRFANVMLWNRFLQTFDYGGRRTSLIVIAHTDPGVPNWLDTEGRANGLVFWCFFFLEEPIQPLATRVVPSASLAARRGP